jgi:hypothetical protein
VVESLVLTDTKRSVKRPSSSQAKMETQGLGLPVLMPGSVLDPFIYLFIYCFVMLGIDPRASHM